MENQKKLKIIVAGAIAVILLCCAAAYMFFGGGATRKTAVNSKEDAALGINATSLPQATLTFAFPGFKPEKSDEVLNELKKKALKELNVKLDFKWDNLSMNNPNDEMKYWNDSENQFDAYCLLYYTDLNTYIRKALKEGLIIDLSELFPKYAPKYYEKFTKDELSHARIDGKLGAIPNNMPVTDRRYALVSEDLMKKYNLPEIKSYDDFEAYLKAVGQNNTQITPLYLNIQNDSFAPYLYDTTLKLFAESYGYAIFDFGLGIVYKWDDPEMKLLAWEQTPDYKDAVLRLKRWRSNGYCKKEGNYFSANEYASIIMNKNDMFGVGRDADYGSILDTRFKIYPLYPDKVSQKRLMFYTGIAVSSKSKNPERLMMFIDWIQSNQENYDLMMYGIKGKNYVLYGDQYGFRKDADSNDKAYMLWTGYQAFLNINNERTNLVLGPDFKAVYMDELNNKSKVPLHSGFNMDLAPVNDIAYKRAQGYCTVEEAIRTESFNEKTIDNFISEQKKNEVGKLLSVLQKQLDDWKATNK